MIRISVEGGPPDEPVEESVVPPDALRKVVGNLRNIEAIEAVMNLGPDSAVFSHNLSASGRKPRSRRRLSYLLI